MQRPSSQSAFTLIELLVVVSIIAMIATMVALNFNVVRMHTRDTRRKSDLDAVNSALAQVSVYSTTSATPFISACSSGALPCVHFSAWDKAFAAFRTNDDKHYWSGGCVPADACNSYSNGLGGYLGSVGPDTGLRNLLTGNGYLSDLPTDPFNVEGGPNPNYLGDGGRLDEAYLFYSPNGRDYILGANLEEGGASATHCGNFQLKSKSSVTCGI